MTELFLSTLNKSISASWLILAVLVLRLLLERSPKWVNVLLWGIVAVRLVCPVSIESALSLVPSAETVAPEIMLDWSPQVNTGIPVLNDAVNSAITASFTPDPAASANPLQIWIPICAAIWLMGILILLLYGAISYGLLCRKLNTAVRLRDNIYQSERVTAPFVLGLAKPRVYLPYAMDEGDLFYVVAHEKAHIRRRDHWWKPLGYLLLAVHWFNPLMWLAYKLLSRDIELACDESVIKGMDANQRADYAQALLACSVRRPVAMACPVAFGEVRVKTRIQSVMRYRKPTFGLVLGVLLICGVLAVCFLTDPKQEPAAEVPEAAPEAVSGAVSPQDTAVGEMVLDMAHFLEGLAPEKTFRDMPSQRIGEILIEYQGLLSSHGKYPRESTDGSIAYLAGCIPGDPEDNPLFSMATCLMEDGQVLYPAGEAAEQAIAAGQVPEGGYLLRESRILYSLETGYYLIVSADSQWDMTQVFSRFVSPNGRAYLSDALSRGISLYPPEGPYLEVSLIHETWGELTEMIPLTETQAAEILAEPRQKLEPGTGFSARLHLGANSAVNREEEAGWYTEFLGVPQSVLDLAVEICSYQFAAPRDIRSDIVEARLDCDWLKEPRYAQSEDLEQLQNMLTNAEFGNVGACGYGARLTIRMEDGSDMVLFKGTDSCDTLVFGSYGGYFLGDAENLQFWTIFGLDSGSKQPLI